MRRKRGREGMRRLRAGLVTPHSGGPGIRPGGIMTPPRGARWTGTGANASSQEARTRGLCFRRKPENASRDGAPRGARVPQKGTRHDYEGCATWRSIPSTCSRGEKREDGVPGTAKPRAISHACLPRRSVAKAGCLKFKSAKVERYLNLARSCGAAKSSCGPTGTMPVGFT